MATVQLPSKQAPGVRWAIIALVAIGVVAVGALAYQAISAASPQAPVVNIPGVTMTTADSVTVLATGEVPAPPDMMTIYMGAQVSRPSARDAMDTASSKTAALATVLKQQGVDPKDIQTQTVSIWRSDNYGQVNYVATNQLRVVIRDLGKADAIIAAGADALGNDASIGSVTLGRKDSTNELNQARGLAMQTAAARAEQWSKLTNRKLGKVIAVNEGSFGYSPGANQGGLGGGASGAVPIEAGNGVVSVQVAVTYRLE